MAQEIIKQTAMQQFRERKSHASEIKRIDNSILHAGSPMYFYCQCCGVPTETLREDYLFRPYSKCSQCAGLEAQGWLEEAMNSYD